MINWKLSKKLFSYKYNYFILSYNYENANKNYFIISYNYESINKNYFKLSYDYESINKYYFGISYYYENDEIAGNVSYEILKEYSGHNYAKKALKLFAKNIFKIDDSDLFISILPNNIASIKTAVGAGAVFDRKIDIPLHSTYSLGGRNKYANRYIIKNNKGVNDEKNKIKKHL